MTSYILEGLSSWRCSIKQTKRAHGEEKGRETGGQGIPHTLERACLWRALHLTGPVHLPGKEGPSVEFYHQTQNNVCVAMIHPGGNSGETGHVRNTFSYCLSYCLEQQEKQASESGPRELIVSLLI